MAIVKIGKNNYKDSASYPIIDIASKIGVKAFL
jgi:hypothetical protein